MSTSGLERSQRREQLLCTQAKIDQCKLPAREGEEARPTRDERDWRDLVEQRIQEAMAAGAFDNLPGAGKPLNLKRNPYLDPSLELAYGLLKNNGYTPEWIARDKEIRIQLEAARARLRAVWRRRQADRTDETAWQAAVTRFEASLAQLNRKIDDLNLIVPFAVGQRVHLRLENELRRLKDE
jgi:DnaJ family protein C protein 28